MTKITIISGSPSHPSRSSSLADYVEKRITAEGLQVNNITVRDLPPEDIALANFSSPAVKEAQLQIEQSDAIIVISPVYKASYPGILKSFLDLIPEKGLEKKVVLPIVTGGTIAHLLSLEYAFKPVFSVLGSNEILNGVYLVDSQINYKDRFSFTEPQAEQRLLTSVNDLITNLKKAEKVIS